MKRAMITLAFAAVALIPTSLMASPLHQTAPSPSAPFTLAGDGKTDAIAPNISGNIMVYSDCSPGGCSVSMLNLTTKQVTLITNELQPVQSRHRRHHCRLAGRAQLYQHRHNRLHKQPRPLRGQPERQAGVPGIRRAATAGTAKRGQGIVVWADYRDAKNKNDPNAGDIYMFDLATRRKRRLPTCPAPKPAPSPTGR